MVSVPCPTCGEQPDQREVDPDRQTRQRVAGVALQELAAEPPGGSALDLSPTEVWGRLSELLEGFMRSLFDGLAGAAAAPALIEALRNLRRLRADVAATPRLRPWVQAWKAVDDVLKRLAEVAEAFLTSVSAETPIEAQAAARRAQDLLDAAAEPASSIGDRLERLARISNAETPEEALVIQAEAAVDESGATSLLELEDRGRDFYRRITGEAESPQGLGVGLALLVAGSSGQFDDDRFWEVAGRGYEVLIRDMDRLRAVVESPSWIPDLNEAAVRHLDAGIGQDAAFRAARNLRQEVRTLMDVGHSLVEISGKRLVATLLCIRPGKEADYEKTRNQDAGALLNRAAQDKQLATLLEGIDRVLRIARAHEDFHVDGDEVVLKSRGAELERLSAHELVDRILAGNESMTALELGLVCALAKAGVSLEQLDSFSQMGLEPLAPARFLLASSGWKGFGLDMEGVTLRVSGTAHLDPRTMHQVAPLVAYLPDAVERLELIAEGEGWQRLVGPVEPFRRAQATDDVLEKLCYFVEGFRNWEADERPLVDEAYVRKWIAILAARAIEEATGNLRSAMRTVRTLRALAQRVGDGELEVVLEGAMEGIRARTMGLPAGSHVPTRMEVLASYLKLRGKSLLE